MESDCNDLISFNVFDSCYGCNIHGFDYIEIDQEPKKATCTICNMMTDEQKSALKKKPKIFTRKMRARVSEQMCTFIGPGGRYQKQLDKMIYHKFSVKMLGTNYCMKSRREEASNDNGVIMTQRDHAERYSPAPNGEIMSEHFGNDRDMSMEGVTVNLKTSAEAEHKTVYYSHLSDEKRQDGNTVYENTRSMLYDLKEREEAFLLTKVLDVADGCAVQYRCGLVLYLISVLATSFGIVYDRLIQAAGHGKGIVDALNGVDKTYLDVFYNSRTSLPEMDPSSTYTVPTHQIENGKRTSLAMTCLRILQDPSRCNGVLSHAKRAKRQEKREIEERRYMVRDIGVAKWDSLNYKAEGFEAGDNNGMRAHYNTVGDPLLGVGVVGMRCFGCSCVGCQAQKAEGDKDNRYGGPSSNCIYWDIFKFPCNTKGYNDWKIIHVQQTQKCDENQATDVWVTALSDLARTISAGVKDGNFGAVNVDGDDDYDYYVVKWVGEPFLGNGIGDDGAFTDGELVCRAKWMYKVPQAPRWYTLSEETTLVWMQQVVANNLELTEECAEFRLSRRLPRTVLNDVAARGGAFMVHARTHDQIMDDIERRENMDFEEFDVIADSDDGDDVDDSGYDDCTKNDDGGSDGDGDDENGESN